MGKFFEEHWSDMDGNPSGGVSCGTGFAISWQHGPLGRGRERKKPNGAFVETILSAAWHRLRFYQAGKFVCAENARAMREIEMALWHLNSRTKNRETRKVEGTHKK